MPGLLLYWPQVIQCLKGLLCLSHTVGSCPLRAASWFGRYIFWWRTAFQLWATYMCWLMCDSRTHALSKATAGSWCESLLHHSVVRAAAQAHVASREAQILQHKIWSFEWSSVVRDALLQCSLLLRIIERLQLLLAGLPSCGCSRHMHLLDAPRQLWLSTSSACSYVQAAAAIRVFDRCCLIIGQSTYLFHPQAPAYYAGLVYPGSGMGRCSLLQALWPYSGVVGVQLTYCCCSTARVRHQQLLPHKRLVHWSRGCFCAPYQQLPPSLRAAACMVSCL